MLRFYQNAATSGTNPKEDNVNIKKAFAQVAIVAMIATGAVAVNNAVTAPETAVTKAQALPSGIQTIGGCIRLYPASALGTPRPEWHVDSDHHTIGINPTNNNSNPDRPVVASDGLLEFWTEEKNPVVSATAAADETLTARGITAGITNGTHLVRIRFFDARLGRALNLNNKSDYARVSGNFSNLWVTLVHDVA